MYYYYCVYKSMSTNIGENTVPWKEETKRYYALLAEHRGWELVGQLRNEQKAIVKLPCGHEDVITIAGLSRLVDKPRSCIYCKLEKLMDKKRPRAL